MQKIHKKFGTHITLKTKNKKKLISFKAFKKKICSKFRKVYYLQNCIGYYA